MSYHWTECQCGKPGTRQCPDCGKPLCDRCLCDCQAWLGDDVDSQWAAGGEW